jgi:SWI/SNF-related matrix-associated actin-dependent regulator 1 of chromatin subfamily A
MARQEAITSFQNDPSVRVAILGVTAASVAVTLTAASTVWFAELFWTPAIQIQAEDRCHRIGQQSIVRCVYFHANGSLDDLLWKLLEQKYRDLGEFVEGKEGKEIKVQEISSYQEVEESKSDDSKDVSTITAIQDEALRNDIIALGMEEEAMLKAGSDDGEDNDDYPSNSPQTSLATQVSSVTPPPPVSSSGFDSTMHLPGMLLYKMDFARSFGFIIAPFEGRMVVKSKTSARVNILGPYAKPDVGDILVMIDGVYLPKDVEYRDVLMMLKNAMINNPPAELVFAEGGCNFRTEFCRIEGLNMAACFQKQGAICPSSGKPIFLPQRRKYSMHFSGNYGIVIQPFQGRMVVKSKSARRIQEFGKHSKPNVGDVLVAVNGHHFPPGSEYMNVLRMLKSAMMSQEPAELTFEEDLAFQSALECRSEADTRQQGEEAALSVQVQG